MYKRDIGMIVPATDMPKDLDYDPAQSDKLKPHLNDPNGTSVPLVEGELVICKDDKDAEDWYVAEIYKVLPTKVQVKYFTTPLEPLEDHSTRSPEKIKERLGQAHFRRTWFFQSGKNAGKGTEKPPYGKNKDLRVWEGPLFLPDLARTILVRGVSLTGAGLLTEETLAVASKLKIPHATLRVVEDDEPDTEEQRLDEISLFSVTRRALCSCEECTATLCGTES